MAKVLVVVDGSRAAHEAVRHVLRRRFCDGALEVHVLHVQRPLRRHVTQFASRESLAGFYTEQAEIALEPVRAALRHAALPYTVHAAVGDKARIIGRTAERLGCDAIVMGAAPSNPLLRLIEDPVVDDLLEATHLPVVMVGGSRISPAERYGVPAGMGAIVALLLMAVAD